MGTKLWVFALTDVESHCSWLYNSTPVKGFGEFEKPQTTVTTQADGPVDNWLFRQDCSMIIRTWTYQSEVKGKYLVIIGVYCWLESQVQSMHGVCYNTLCIQGQTPRAPNCSISGSERKFTIRGTCQGNAETMFNNVSSLIHFVEQRGPTAKCRYPLTTHNQESRIKSKAYLI